MKTHAKAKTTPQMRRVIVAAANARVGRAVSACEPPQSGFTRAAQERSSMPLRTGVGRLATHRECMAAIVACRQATAWAISGPLAIPEVDLARVLDGAA